MPHYFVGHPGGSSGLSQPGLSLWLAGLSLWLAGRLAGPHGLGLTHIRQSSCWLAQGHRSRVHLCSMWSSHPQQVSRAASCGGLKVPKCNERASPSGPALFKSGLCLMLSCWPTQSQCGEGLPKGMNVGKWEQTGVITAQSAKVWNLYIYTVQSVSLHSDSALHQQQEVIEQRKINQAVKATEFSKRQFIDPWFL